MTVYKEFRVGGGNQNSPMGFLGPLLILAVFFTVMFFLFKGLFFILNIIAPILLILTLIIDYTVVKDFFIFLFRLLKDNPLMGILSFVLLFFGYHIVSGYLFAKAILRKTVRKKFADMKKREDTYDEYIEVKEEEKDKKLDEFLELPPLQKQKNKDNPYDDMFK